MEMLGDAIQKQRISKDKARTKTQSARPIPGLNQAQWTVLYVM